MRRSLVSMLLAVVVLASIPLWASEATGSEDAKAILDKIQQAAGEMNSFEADMSMSMSVMNQPMNMTGHMAVLKPDLMRMTMTMPPQGDMQIVSDGATMWTYIPMMNMVQKIDASVMKQAPGMGGPGAQMEDPTKTIQQMDPATVQFLGEEMCDGQTCYVIEGALPQQAKQMGGQFVPEKMKAWAAQADGIPRKIEMMDSSGTPMMTMTFTNVKINTEFPENHFTFTPPPGAQIMDMTETIRSMMKQQQGAPPQQ